MTYVVKFIGEDDLPEGQDWVATKCDDRCVLFVKRSCCGQGSLPQRAVLAIWRMAGITEASTAA